MLPDKVEYELDFLVQEIDLTEKHPIVANNSSLIIASPVCKLSACKTTWDTETRRSLPFIDLHSGVPGHIPFIYDSQIIYADTEDGLPPTATFDAGYLSYLLLNPVHTTIDLAPKKDFSTKRYSTLFKFPNLLIDDEFGLVNLETNEMQLHPVFPFCVGAIGHSDLNFSREILRGVVQTEYLETLRSNISTNLKDDKGLPNPNIVKANSAILLDFANKIAGKGINISTALLSLYLSILKKHIV